MFTKAKFKIGFSAYLGPKIKTYLKNLNHDNKKQKK